MQLRSIAAALLLVATPVAAIADDAAPTFGHWTASCRGDGYCSATSAVSLSPDPGAPVDFELHVGRPARQTYWELGIATLTTLADARAPFTARIGGKDFSFTPPNGVAAYGGVADYYFLGKEAQQLMDRLPRGSAVTIGFTAFDGSPRSSSFPLTGLSAALLWIDTQQHRIGSERVVEPPPYGQPRVTLAPAKSIGGPPTAGAPLGTATLFDPPVLTGAFGGDATP